jgi:hypothetical protein
MHDLNVRELEVEVAICAHKMMENNVDDTLHKWKQCSMSIITMNLTSSLNLNLAKIENIYQSRLLN